MTTLKFIPVLFLSMVIFISTSYKNVSGNHYIYTDTVYIASTDNFKSNYIPDSVFTMTQLKKLVVSGRDCDVRLYDQYGKDTSHCWMIQEIPASIGNLVNLDTLRLTLGAFWKLPDEISRLQKLKVLDLTDTYMSTIDNVTALTNLNQLLLYGCHLSKLPDDIGKLANLKFIGLVGNNLDNAEINRIKKALPNCEVYFH
jgi:hypothetical protein